MAATQVRRVWDTVLSFRLTADLTVLVRRGPHERNRQPNRDMSNAAHLLTSRADCVAVRHA